MRVFAVRYWMAIGIALVVLAAGGLVACYRAVDHALMVENLPEVEHGRGRTAQLEAELEAHHLYVPRGATEITYTVTSSWDLNRLAVRFTIAPDELDSFVASFGEEAQLRPADSSWDIVLVGLPERYRWTLPSVNESVGFVIRNPGGIELQHTVIVDVSGPDRVVYMEGAW